MDGTERAPCVQEIWARPAITREKGTHELARRPALISGLNLIKNLRGECPAVVRAHEGLGHADPSLTLRVNAHAVPEDEYDLSFSEFNVPGQHYTSPASVKRAAARRALGATDRSEREIGGARDQDRSGDKPNRERQTAPSQHPLSHHRRDFRRPGTPPAFPLLAWASRVE